MKIYIAFICFLIISNIFGQADNLVSNCECDSLFTKYESQIMLDIGYSKIYKYKGDWDSLKTSMMNEVIEILPNKEKYLLFVGIIIDTSGNIRCLKKYEGVSKLVDDIVLDRIKNLKFEPYELLNKKIEMLTKIDFINLDRKSLSEN